MRPSIALLISLMLAPAALAAGGSELLNYQGVLRDAGGNPRQGTFDMRFRFFDAQAAGNELLIDEHIAAGTGGVVVTGGLFNVPLGSGSVLDGSGPGIYANLAQIFGQLDSVWLEIQVGGETLTPRVAVRASAYAMNARSLQGKDANAFLASDTSDAFTSGTLTLDPGTVLDVNGETHLDGSLFMHHGGPDASQFIQFYDGGSPAGERFGWNETMDRFTLSNTLHLENNSRLEQTGDALYLNSAGPDRPQAIYFYDTGEPTGQSLYWDDSNHRFWLSADTTIAGALTMDGDLRINGNDLFIANAGPDQNQRLGFFDDNVSGNEFLLWDNANDRFQLTNDLYTTGTLRLDGDTITLNAVGPDANQTLRFYEDGLEGGESIQWDDAQDRFEITDDLAIQGVLRTATTGVAPVAYNTIGNGAATSTDITNTLDLFVTGDLEVGDQLYMGGDNLLEWYTLNNYNMFHFSTGVHVGDGVGENLIVGGNRLYLQAGVPGGTPDHFLEHASNTFSLTDDLAVTGTLTASNKNFVQNHPYDPALEVVYTTLEGPEAATFTRGSARLENGSVRIPLEGSFSWVTQPGLGLTVSLTPRGGWANLYVESISTSELVVAATPDSPADIAFDYLVMGMRIGYEDAPVVRPRTRNAPLPEPATLRAQLAGRTDLLGHTPMARFRETEARVFGKSDVDLAPGIALRDAVGTDPNIASATGFLDHGPETASQGSPRIAANQAPAQSAPTVPTPSHITVSAPAQDRPDSKTYEDEQGNIYARSFRPNSGGLDSVSSVIGDVAPGDVLALDPSGSGVRRADLAEDATVVGIATGVPTPDRAGGTSVSFAVAGIVTCNVDATAGAIRPGDLLVSSPNAGYAVRADAPSPGTIVGKALQALEGGTGTIRMLVVLR